ncbi:MAG: S9 family peptidase [Gemmatimonadetes bacterium]|nr:S9 family peptidase [Gemmatimonadota bacterium]
MSDLPPEVRPAPPVAERRRTVLTLHGEARLDDYAWLRERDNPEVTAYLEAENAYTAAMTAHTTPLQEQLYAEMLARIQEDDATVPVPRGEWRYYTRTEKGKAYPIFCRMAQAEAGAASSGAAERAREHVILDQNAEAEGREFYQLGAFEVSPDHRLLAILEDTAGYEDFTLRVRDLSTGEWLPDRLEKLGFGLAWASDSRTIFYTTTDEAKRSDRVWRHALGAPRDQDAEVFHEPGVLNNVGVHRARSGTHVVITSASFTDGEAWLVDAVRPASPPALVRARRAQVEYDVEPGDGWLYVCTNEEAPNFKVMRAPLDRPGAWEEWLEHRPDTFVEGVLVFKRFVLVQERRSGLRTLRVTDVARNETHYIEFPQAAYGVQLGANPEFDQQALRFTYSSLATPDTVFDYDLATRARIERKKEPVLGGFDESRYAIERLEATARDGTRVPISLVYRTPFARDASRPLLLYAYGSYGFTMEPTFNSQRISLLDRGFVYAIAHVRGGQEMGRAWYDDGKMMKKLNTFTDFIDVAEHLVRERYTSPERLAANGGSAGGLLMGVVANLRPDLFRTIVADVPFVDVINTMLDDSIPLTAQEWLQWGNPQESEAYAYMRQYSPYDNVTAQAYPRLLVTSGVNDSRVAFWEPAKWVAKLRVTSTGTQPLLLKMNMGAGHGGASGRYERLRETAFRYAFILEQ